jgi:hypothetical protein
MEHTGMRARRARKTRAHPGSHLGTAVAALVFAAAPALHAGQEVSPGTGQLSAPLAWRFQEGESFCELSTSRVEQTMRLLGVTRDQRTEVREISRFVVSELREDGSATLLRTTLHLSTVPAEAAPLDLARVTLEIALSPGER